MIFRKIFSFLFLFLFSWNLVIADSPFVQIDQQLDLWMVKNNQINNVVVKFCTDWLTAQHLQSEIEFSLRPRQAKDICVILVNQSDQSITLVPEILAATLNTQWNIVCSSNTPLTWDFFVQDFGDVWKNIVLASWEQFIGRFTVKTLDSWSGKYYWCLGISSDLQELSPNSPLYLKIRKAIYMNVVIGWELYYFQWWDNFVSLLFSNQRRIAQAWIILCVLWLIYFSIPLISPHKKKPKKSSKHTL
jgi:hypothetical protein